MRQGRPVARLDARDCVSVATLCIGCDVAACVYPTRQAWLAAQLGACDRVSTATFVIMFVATPHPATVSTCIQLVKV